MIYANGQATPQLPHNALFGYDPPEIHQVVPEFLLDFPGVARGPIVIMGKNFGGYADKSLDVTIAGEKCLRLHWMSDGMLVCLCVDRANPPSAGMSAEKGITVKVGGLSATYPDFNVVQVPVLLSDEFTGNVRCPPARDLAALLLAPKMNLLRSNLQDIEDVMSGNWPPEKGSESATSTSGSESGSESLDINKTMENILPALERNLTRASDMIPLRVLVTSSIGTIDEMINNLKTNGTTSATTASTVTKLKDLMKDWRKRLDEISGTTPSREIEITKVHDAGEVLQRIRDLVPVNKNSSSSASSSSQEHDIDETLKKEQEYLNTLLEDLNKIDTEMKKNNGNNELRVAIQKFNRTINNQNVSSALTVWGGRLGKLVDKVEDLKDIPVEDIPFETLLKISNELTEFSKPISVQDVEKTKSTLESAFEPLSDVGESMEPVKESVLSSASSSDSSSGSESSSASTASGGESSSTSTGTTSSSPTQEKTPLQSRVSEYNDALSKIKDTLGVSPEPTAEDESSSGSEVSSGSEGVAAPVPAPAPPVKKEDTLSGVVKTVLQKIDESISKLKEPSWTYKKANPPVSGAGSEGAGSEGTTTYTIKNYDPPLVPVQGNASYVFFRVCACVCTYVYLRLSISTQTTHTHTRRTYIGIFNQSRNKSNILQDLGHF